MQFLSKLQSNSSQKLQENLKYNMEMQNTQNSQNNFEQENAEVSTISDFKL